MSLQGINAIFRDGHASHIAYPIDRWAYGGGLVEGSGAFNQTVEIEFNDIEAIEFVLYNGHASDVKYALVGIRFEPLG